MELNFFDIFSTNIQISNFMKIAPVGGELFHANRRADMTNLIASFRNYRNAPDIVGFCGKKKKI